MEHSWIGDLWISLSCPNQQSVTILKKNASGINGDCASAIPATALGWSTADASNAHFGLYYEPDGYGHCNGDGNPIGECWNYCWSNAATQGYQYACGQGLVYESCNHLDNVDNPHGGASSSSSNYVDSTNMATMTNVYHPDESFANLIGCPLNGIWSIQVVDAWASDNGYICEWELALNPNTPVFLSETEVSETPCPQAASVTDYDGNVYGTVAIGSQCWMRENLRTTHTASGTAIIPGNGTDAGTAHYYLPSASDSSGIYGHLYNWKAAENVCPDGWHLPSDSEWAQLTDFLGSLDTCVCGDNPNNVARAMASDTFWSPSSTPCAVGSDLSLNNISNFSTLPVGYTNGTPTAFGTTARFWTATSYNNDYAYYRSLYHDNGFVERNPYGDKAYGMSVRCILAKTPKVTTAAVTNVTDSTAVCGGEVTSIGGAPMTERGLCWSTHAYPTIGDNLVACGAGLGTFTGQMTGLIPGTTYYARAYATNHYGTEYGDEMSFTTLASTNTIPDGQPCPCSATVTDIDSNTYNTVKIGNQCWMKENLRVLHYANGENIPTGTQGSYTVSYYYDYPSGFALEDRGYLYNWAAVMHGVNSSTANPSGVQGVCPTGWHVPSEAEWDQLTSYMGQGQYACGNSG